MNKLILGLLCGLGFGIVDVLVMIPLKYENKQKKIEAMSSAFVERFVLGFLVPNIDLGINYIWSGLILGLVMSVPSAIITRAYVPIIIIGIIGGGIIGYITQMVLF